MLLQENAGTAVGKSISGVGPTGEKSTGDVFGRDIGRTLSKGSHPHSRQRNTIVPPKSHSAITDRDRIRPALICIN